MTPWLQDADVTLYHGDVLETLRELPAESVDCVVTSPPYWGLRDYGQEGQLGLEPTPEQYVERMVEVFREVRRVLATHGTVWLNLGDSYSSGGREGAPNDPSDGVGQRGNRQGRNVRAPVVQGIKPKDLVGIPWRVAFALQADGWYLRSDIIWSKPNPMPESVTDRPTKAHEYVFLLSKQPRYFFDQEAVRERWEDGYKGRLDGSPASNGRIGGPGGFKAKGPDGRHKTSVVGQDGSIQHRDGERWPNGGRNIRSVWEIATQPYPEAHFATFPEELARRCIAAGTSEKGKCPKCGAPWVRIMGGGHNPYPGSSTDHTQDGMMSCGAQKHPSGRSAGTIMARRHYERVPPETVGWDPSCAHRRKNGGFHGPVPSVVLDPFIGSGTVAFVARKLGRHAIGIDLSAAYLELAARRLQQQSLLTELSA